MAGALRVLVLKSFFLIVLLIQNNEARTRFVRSYYSTSHSRVSSHSYPKTSNTHISASNRHGYPSSQGLSGNTYNSRGSNNHGYPQSGSGLSGSGNFASNYPQRNTNHGVPTTNSHGYPTSNGLSGSGVRQYGTNYAPSYTNHGVPTNSHGYPNSNGLSGSGVRQYGTNYGPSYHGNNYNGHYKTTHHNSNYYHQQNVYKTTTVHNHHHYHYTPPSTIYYTPSYSMHPVIYPVYRGDLPVYVYEYRSLGSRFSTLLAGLALYNLGRISANSNMNHYHNYYNPQENERCIFGVRYENGNFEEMKINCHMITNYIWSDLNEPQNTGVNNVVTNSQTVTVVNTTNYVVPNQAVIPQNFQPSPTGTGINTIPNAGVINTSSVTTTTTTQVVDATDPRFRGQPVHVTSGMVCYVMRTTLTSRNRHNVPCDLLQTYASQSLRRNMGFKSESSMYLILVLLAMCLVF